MGVAKLSLSLDRDLADVVRHEAAEEGTSVSAWLAAAAEDRIRNRLLGRAMNELAHDVGDAQRNQVPVRTITAAVAQDWRDGARQVRLVRVLRGVDGRALDRVTARRIGRLLAAARMADVVGSTMSMPRDSIW